MDQMNLAAAGPALGSNASYIEKLYARWKESPGAVAEAWQTYFTQLETGAVPDSGVIARAGAEARPSCIPENEVLAFAQRQVAVQQLVAAYRNLGAEISDLDPLKNQPARVIPELDPSYYGLTDADLDQVFSTANTYFGRASMTLRELIEALRETYCGKIGAEFMYITDPEEKRWWQQRLESIRSAPSLTPEAKVHILERLTASEGLEHFLHKRYTGQKRFSLEGGESFIVAMDRIVEDAASRGMKEIVIGMAHRGRLNVLVNIQNKDLQALYDEFDGKESAESLPSGDVKYHNGFENSVPTASGPIWVSMEFNPSHLEAADPVALGSVRAREDQLGDREGNQVLGILVHGDAAFSGQGIVQETLNLASTRGFGTGGTVHIVINNQIGFTTSDPRDKGSMLYCTDPAKVTETPVLHVNGDEPESVALATQIAMECRLRFHRDVVLDIVCYRRLGHNEQDTPAVTQPLMYKKIDVHPTVRELYGKALEENGTIPEGRAQEMDRYVRDRLKKSENPRVIPESLRAKHVVDWSPWIGKARTEPATSVPVAKLTELGRAITAVPAAFRLHPLVIRVLDSRRQMAEGAAPVDWGMAEHLAFASLLSEGHPVRISGEDSGRGTFSHRHAVLHDQDRAKRDVGEYIPLQHVSRYQAPFTVEDSPLSEYSVMGFEYGYASASPNALVIWEAQFGDFANTAQVIIDQFISSAEAKWGRQNGLVLMLPHGYEGQGPEHSSARVERYLQLAAGDNFSVVQPTIAAQIFHVLRRQVLRPYRKPLILFTPKSLLRNPNVASPLSDLTSGGFQPVIGDAAVDPARVTRAVLASGRVYYDLLKKREELSRNDVALIRVEELYPFPAGLLTTELARYPGLDEVVWCQDEPRNQGPWNSLFPQLLDLIPSSVRLSYAGRDENPAPATGYAARFKREEAALLEAAFGTPVKSWRGVKGE